jgi:hypothetical protein
MKRSITKEEFLRFYNEKGKGIDTIIERGYENWDIHRWNREVGWKL